MQHVSEGASWYYAYNIVDIIGFVKLLFFEGALKALNTYINLIKLSFYV